jgi:hypothetical protein
LNIDKKSFQVLENPFKDEIESFREKKTLMEMGHNLNHFLDTLKLLSQNKERRKF